MGFQGFLDNLKQIKAKSLTFIKAFAIFEYSAWLSNELEQKSECKNS